MKTQFRLLIIVLLSLCQEKGPAQNPIDTLYQGCCGTAAVQITMNNSLIYVPNIFTPNGDAINDLFKPFFDETKVALVSFVIKDKNSENVIWTLSPESLNEPHWGWFGYYLADQLPYRGKFTYVVVFRNLATNAQQTISGSAFSVYCLENEPKINIETLSQCFFPCQYEGNYVHRESIIDIEIDCLKP
jgi:hypothetical protein